MCVACANFAFILDDVINLGGLQTLQPTGMHEIESIFDKTFAHWEIRLPPDAIAERRRGKIVKRGWAIWYLFGTDERGEYVDYYASHRMTNDRHVRIYADGSKKDLPTILSSRRCSEDPEADARLEAEFQDSNAKTAKILEDKGFGMKGDEPAGVRINRFLNLQKP